MVKIFSLEGNIGSGKSTLVRLMKKRNPSFIYMLEPVDEWNNIVDKSGENILTKFYRDQKKYSFSFQMMAYISRLAKLKRLVKNNPHSVIITERSVLTDKNVFAKMLYDDGNIEEVNYTIYLKWFEEFIKEIPVDGFIYIDVTPQTSYKRVLKRNRTGEDIPIEYLERCGEYHEQWLASEDNVMRLNGNMDFENDDLVMETFIEKISNFVFGENTRNVMYSFKEACHC